VACRACGRAHIVGVDALQGGSVACAASPITREGAAARYAPRLSNRTDSANIAASDREA
jgi:hypothetical protein